MGNSPRAKTGAKTNGRPAWTMMSENMPTLQDEGTHAASVHVISCYDHAPSTANFHAARAADLRPHDLRPCPRGATQSRGVEEQQNLLNEARPTDSVAAARNFTKRKQRWNNLSQAPWQNRRRLSPPPPPPGSSRIPDVQSFNPAPRANHLATLPPLVAKYASRRPWRGVDGIRAKCAGHASSQAEDRVGHPIM